MQPTSRDRAISPVVGTALLLAVVAILGAFTFSAVAFSVNDRLVEQTQADLSVEPTSSAPSSGDGGSTVTIAHNGGSTLETNDITVYAKKSGVRKPLSAYTSHEHLDAGDRLILTASEIGAAESGDEIAVRWKQQGQSLRMSSTAIEGPASTDTPTPTPSATPSPTPRPTDTPTGTPGCEDEEDHDRGHGNDCDHDDEDNPGNGGGLPGPFF